MRLEVRKARAARSTEAGSLSSFSELAERMANEPENLKRHLREVAKLLCFEPSVSGVVVEVSSTTGEYLCVHSGMRVGLNTHEIPLPETDGISGSLHVHYEETVPETSVPKIRMASALISLGVSNATALKSAAEQKASLSAVQVASEVLGTIIEEGRLYSTVLLLIQELMGSEASVIFSSEGEPLASLGFEKFPVEFETLRDPGIEFNRSWRGSLEELGDSGEGFAVCSLIGSSDGKIYLYRKSGRYRGSEEHTLRLVARQLARARERSRLHAALENSSIEMTESLAAALESRDGMTGGHINRTQDMVESVARKLELSVDIVRTARFAAVLHDIGKIAVPDAILNKPGKLDEREWEIMRQHPAKGAKILSGISGFERVAAAVFTHHERFDGGGYPQGISGEEIPIEARIISVVDAYDAMTSDRPYRKALPHEVAFAELDTQSGRQFDPSVVQALKELIEDGPTERKSTDD